MAVVKIASQLDSWMGEFALVDSNISDGVWLIGEKGYLDRSAMHVLHQALGERLSP